MSDEIKTGFDDFLNALKNCEDLIENSKIDKAKRQKKYSKKLLALADSLENANYHSECAIVCQLRDAYKEGKLESAENVFDFLLEKTDWKDL
jgi:hypothetical protein